MREQLEAPTRAQGREELHAWIIDQISIGAIHDRGSMIEVLREVGYEVPRLGKDYLTVNDPETGERWRLKGEIFREGWQAPTAAPERQAEHRSGQDQGRECRLDGVTAGELQERFAEHCERGADYNRVRYQGLRELERDALAQSPQRDHAGDLAQAPRRDLGPYREACAVDAEMDLGRKPTSWMAKSPLSAVPIFGLKRPLDVSFPQTAPAA